MLLERVGDGEDEVPMVRGGRLTQQSLEGQGRAGLCSGSVGFGFGLFLLHRAAAGQSCCRVDGCCPPVGPAPELLYCLYRSRTACVPQHWLTDEDIGEVMAQYDTNRDGVIRWEQAVLAWRYSQQRCMQG